MDLQENASQNAFRKILSPVVTSKLKNIPEKGHRGLGVGGQSCFQKGRFHPPQIFPKNPGRRRSRDPPKVMDTIATGLLPL